MTNHKQQAKSMTIEELRLYVNEYQKRKYDKDRKKKHNAYYTNKKSIMIKSSKEKHNDYSLKGKALDIFQDMKGGIKNK